MKNSPRNKVRVLDFSPGSFALTDLPEILGYKAISWNPSSQIKYLTNYLNLIGAKTIVAEYHYIDRHFMDEYQRYYSTCFYNFGNSCIRLHFFKEPFDTDKLNRALRCSNTKAESFFRKSDNYLGFVVFRPIPKALISRTLLTPIQDPHIDTPVTARNISVTIEKKVHMLGLELFIKGLPFQQQDRRVGACASTAVWSALCKVAKSDGMRAPSPAEVTELAVKFNIPFGRPYPQSG
jgi:hypothetical protein